MRLIDYSALKVFFRGNTYSEVSMGVDQFDPSNPSFLLTRGSMNKLYNVLFADFQDENYTNIGAFTLEHLNEVMKVIKNEQSYLPTKVMLNTSML